EYRPCRSAAAERLVRRARVLHADAERRALLRLADHVGRLDVHLRLAEPLRGPCEGARLVREAHLDELAIGSDPELAALERSPRLRAAAEVWAGCVSARRRPMSRSTSDSSSQVMAVGCALSRRDSTAHDTERTCHVMRSSEPSLSPS